MTPPAVGQLPEGTRGFDCNTKVSAAAATLFFAAGYRFAIRYVRRSANHSYDIDAAELTTLRQAGLAVMLVQHVADPDWFPSFVNGRGYGAIAAGHAAQAGYPHGATLWCDLEGVAHTAAEGDVIGYCNAWQDRVKAAGFVPGLYVGDRCGLSSRQLYRDLRFRAYWSAYNLNLDNYPAVRGIQLAQREYPHPEHRVPGVTFEYDEDVIKIDSLGGCPELCMADPLPREK